jgi:indole-3-glycerol phosphate synthase
MLGLTTTNTILDKIVARKIAEVAVLPSQFPSRQTPLRPFEAALRGPNVRLIAEIKQASPSKGVLISPFDPVSLAQAYAQHGAAAISVLTDQDFFMGHLDHLQSARAAVNLPILRKDFTIDARQIHEAHSAGADAILLIAAILDDAKLADLYAQATGLGLSALVEVHTEAEMLRALRLQPALIGINNRDLHSFKVSLETTARLAALLEGQPNITLVAESGIFTPADVATVAAVGARAILVGESIMKAADMAAQISALSTVAIPTKN